VTQRAKGAYLVVRTLPLPRDYDLGEVVTVVEKGKEFRMRLVREALKGDREIWVVPHDGSGR
jgi:hypothetical protein